MFSLGRCAPRLPQQRAPSGGYSSSALDVSLSNASSGTTRAPDLLLRHHKE
jgi:hypothetical protein